MRIGQLFGQRVASARAENEIIRTGVLGRRIRRVQLSLQCRPAAPRSLGRLQDRELYAFIKQAIAPGSTAKTAGLSSYAGLAEVDMTRMSSAPWRGHIILLWIHTTFSTLKPWGKGVCHGLRRPYLQFLPR
jgi:hypothetical protein